MWGPSAAKILLPVQGCAEHPSKSCQKLPAFHRKSGHGPRCAIHRDGSLSIRSRCDNCKLTAGYGRPALMWRNSWARCLAAQEAIGTSEFFRWEQAQLDRCPRHARLTTSNCVNLLRLPHSKRCASSTSETRPRQNQVKPRETWGEARLAWRSDCRRRLVQPYREPSKARGWFRHCQGARLGPDRSGGIIPLNFNARLDRRVCE